MAEITLVDARNPIWPTHVLPKIGVAYVATGKRFADEARISAEQLRRSNPTLSVCLITDQTDYQPAFWDDRVLVQNPHFGFRDKILMGLCPYERFLYLDGDTYVAGDLAPAFRLLEQFDFVGHQLFEGNDCPLPEVSDAFPEFNGGVVGYRRSPALGDFFARWMANYDRYYAMNRDGHYHYSNVSDQKTLRLTVYQSSLRIAVLGPEYDFVPQHVNFACAPVRIIHGRCAEGFGTLEKRLNARFGNRAYIPRLDVIVMDDPVASELRRLWWRVTLQLIRRGARHCTPIGLRNWLRRSATVRGLFLQNKFSGETDHKKWHAPEAKKS